MPIPHTDLDVGVIGKELGHGSSVVRMQFGRNETGACGQSAGEPCRPDTCPGAEFADQATWFGSGESLQETSDFWYAHRRGPLITDRVTGGHTRETELVRQRLRLAHDLWYLDCGIERSGHDGDSLDDAFNGPVRSVVTPSSPQ